MIRILLTGHGCSDNRGGEAIVRSTVKIIEKNIKESLITLLSMNPSSDRAELWPELNHLKIPDVRQIFPNKYNLGRIINEIEQRVVRRIVPGSPSFFSLMNYGLYKNTDVIISIGGDNFWGGYGSQSHFFGELDLARSFGKTTVIWGASISDFTRRIEKKWAKQLNLVDLITVREKMSLDYLASIGVRENVRLVADPAFILSPQKEGAEIIRRKGSEVIIGIGLSAMVTRFGIEHSKYHESFLEFVKYLLKYPENLIVLIPHVLYELKSDNDYLACKYFASKINEKERIRIVDDNFNACQLKFIISQCDYFIGSRMHSTIASLSSLVPTISIAYSPKYKGINHQIFGHSDYVISVQELNGGKLIKKYTDMKRSKNEIMYNLNERIPEQIKLAEISGVYLAEVLKRKFH